MIIKTGEKHVVSRALMLLSLQKLRKEFLRKLRREIRDRTSKVGACHVHLIKSTRTRKDSCDSGLESENDETIPSKYNGPPNLTFRAADPLCNEVTISNFRKKRDW